MVGKINIVGEIGSFGDNKGVELIDVISQVRKQPEATSFEVYINSPGGSVDTGFDIYYFLRSIGLPITTIGSGTVASIATVIYMAGNKRELKPDTRFMIHLPMVTGLPYATADEIEAEAKNLREVENRIINFYSKELGLNKEAVTPLLRNETWLNHEQLETLGFVTQQSEAPVFAIVKQKSNKMSKTSIFKTMLAALRGEVVNKVIYSADAKELVFPDLSEDDPIEVGAKATYDGMPAEGEITTAEGKVYVFEAGILVEIKDKAAEETIEEEFVEVLTGVLEVAANLEARLKKVETETVALTAQRDDFKAKLDAANTVIAKLKGSSLPPPHDVTDKGSKKSTVSDLVANWRKTKTNKK